MNLIKYKHDLWVKKPKLEISSAEKLSILKFLQISNNFQTKSLIYCEF